MLLLSKIDLISQHEREELIAIFASLNARAQIVPKWSWARSRWTDSRYWSVRF